MKMENEENIVWKKGFDNILHWTELNGVTKKIDNFTLALVQQIPNPYKKRMV